MGKLTLQISRPFRLGGFATGDYMCKCMTCDGGFIGDKRAITCLPCAADRLDAARSEGPSPGYDGGKSLGERLCRSLMSAGLMTGLGDWSAADPETQAALDRAAVTFTASLSGGETCQKCGEILQTGPWGFTDCPACNPMNPEKS